MREKRQEIFSFSAKINALNVILQLSRKHSFYYSIGRVSNVNKSFCVKSETQCILVEAIILTKITN